MEIEDLCPECEGSGTTPSGINDCPECYGTGDATQGPDPWGEADHAYEMSRDEACA